MEQEKPEPGMKLRRAGWWEDYSCGCVSATKRYKRDLLGYCHTHGNSRRRIWNDRVFDCLPRAESPR